MEDHSLAPESARIEKEQIVVLTERIPGKNPLEPYIGKRRREWKGGKKHGIWLDWWEDGTLFRKREYKEGSWHGTWKAWYRNGSLRCKQEWRDNKKHGEFRIWKEDGEPFSDERWEEGVWTKKE